MDASITVELITDQLFLGSKSRNVSHKFENDMEGFLDDWNTAEKESGFTDRLRILKVRVRFEL